jgi:hypothetical protein
MSISNAKHHTQRALELIEKVEPNRSASSQTRQHCGAEQRSDPCFAH